MKAVLILLVLIMLAPVACSAADQQAGAKVALASKLDAIIALTDDKDQADSLLKRPEKDSDSKISLTDSPETKSVRKLTHGWGGDPARYFPGAFIGFLGHESGHLVMNTALNTHLFLKPVHYGPIPFFTIEPGRYLNPREHYVIASAGFTSQNLTSEWLLTKHPNLRTENEPFLKGYAHFNFWLSVGYAASAFTRTGPAERDTKGMADSLGWNERWVGAMILTPALLDAYRYDHPQAKWAKTASRISKLAIIAVALKAN